MNYMQPAIYIWHILAIWRIAKYGGHQQAPIWVSVRE
jgi:hypothetical protein